MQGTKETFFPLLFHGGIAESQKGTPQGILEDSEKEGKGESLLVLVVLSYMMLGSSRS